MLDDLKANLKAPVLTQENHPENRPDPAAPTPAPAKSTLFRTIAISIFAGMLGMVYGVTALSSTLILDEPVSFWSMIPLVAMLVAIVTGWVGGMIWMIANEGNQGPEI